MKSLYFLFLTVTVCFSGCRLHENETQIIGSDSADFPLDSSLSYYGPTDGTSLINKLSHAAINVATEKELAWLKKFNEIIPDLSSGNLKYTIAGHCYVYGNDKGGSFISFEKIKDDDYIMSSSNIGCFEKGAKSKHEVNLVRVKNNLLSQLFFNGVYMPKLEKEFDKWARALSPTKRWWLNIDTNEKTISISGTKAYHAFYKDYIAMLQKQHYPFLTGVKPTNEHKKIFALIETIKQRAKKQAQLKKQREELTHRRLLAVQQQETEAKKREAHIAAIQKQVETKRKLNRAQHIQKNASAEKKIDYRALGEDIGKILKIFSSKKSHDTHSYTKQNKNSKYQDCWKNAANQIATCTVSMGDCDAVGCNTDSDCDKGWNGSNCEYTLNSSQPSYGLYYCDTKNSNNYDKDLKTVINRICLEN